MSLYFTKSPLCEYTLCFLINLNISIVHYFISEMLTGVAVRVVDFERHSCTGDSWAGPVLFSFQLTASVDNVDENLCVSYAYAVLFLPYFSF